MQTADPVPELELHCKLLEVWHTVRQMNKPCEFQSVPITRFHGEIKKKKNPKGPT